MPDDSITAEELTEDEVRWRDGQRAGAASIAAHYLGRDSGASPSIQDIHDAYDAWIDATEKKSFLGRFRKSEHPDANTIAIALGVALGDRIAEATGLEWRIITDSFGTDLGLYGEGVGGAYGPIVTHPMNFIAKRITDRERNWLRPAAEALIRQIVEMQHASDDPD